MSERLPSVTFVIPTLNAGRVLGTCLDTIQAQDYPPHRLEVLIVDGGSTDATREIAAQYAFVRILDNPLQTAEAGKAIGIDAAQGSLVAFVDSDNLLDGRDWLQRMVAPFADAEIVSSEVLFWAYRSRDSLVNRYCALTGINDPTCLFLGNYDRYSHLTGRWTDYPHTEIDCGEYLEVRLDPHHVPTMGANGYLVRREILTQLDYRPYFFDIDAVQELARRGFTKMARVKVGITHLYAENTAAFARKQRRRIRDYFYFRRQGKRTYHYPLASLGFLKFLFYTILTIPTLIQAIRGYRKIPDIAWFFHPLACWITLGEYSWGFLWGMLRPQAFQRRGWVQ